MQKECLICKVLAYQAMDRQAFLGMATAGGQDTDHSHFVTS